MTYQAAANKKLNKLSTDNIITQLYAMTKRGYTSEAAEMVFEAMLNNLEARVSEADFLLVCENIEKIEDLRS